ncbi:MAG: NAD(P)/FAD-dependent oxidoreductase [Phycisphaeraceae bacterium]|nr:NAD(P)/FAD-dependent oxidoreductase [Phycisphaeraceae bacterium]
MVHKRDLIVVGGSFAGLACAQAAAECGASVVLLDSKPDPALRLHTTGLLVQEVMDQWDPPGHRVRPIRGVRLYAPNLQSVDLHRPGYAFWATDTGGLLQWAAQRAAARGVQMRYGCRFVSARPHDRRIRLDPQPWAGRFLVGADGARSRVARTFGLETNRDFLIGLEVEMTGVRGLDPDRLHVLVDAKLAPGYIAWAFEGVGRTQIGLAVRPPAYPRIEPLLKKWQSLFDFRKARIIGRRGGQIPVGGPLNKVANERVLLIGDAAGAVSPLTAGGIHTALQLGRLAGEATASWLSDPAATHPARSVRAATPRYRFKKLMRRAIDRPLPNGWINLAMRTGPLRALAQVIFYHHRGLLSIAGLRDAARALVTGRA